ncbi:uncharacterized protein METZ01_LOCUS142374, partial [marine metagenome]
MTLHIKHYLNLMIFLVHVFPGYCGDPL